MSQPRPRDPIAALLGLVADDEPTAEEADQELREMGVDVDAFLAETRRRSKGALGVVPLPSTTTPTRRTT